MTISAWPVEIRVDKDLRVLTITFDNGDVKILSAEALRVESPSAEVQGHTPSQKIIITGKEHVKIMAVEPVGHYAVRITFDDEHNTGIYTWEYLYNFPQK